MSKYLSDDDAFSVFQRVCEEHPEYIGRFDCDDVRTIYGLYRAVEHAHRMERSAIAHKAQDTMRKNGAVIGRPRVALDVTGIQRDRAGGMSIRKLSVKYSASTSQIFRVTSGEIDGNHDIGRIIELHERGLSQRAICAELGLSKGTVQRVIQKK